jgi:hypothetical protein
MLHQLPPFFPHHHTGVLTPNPGTVTVDDVVVGLDLVDGRRKKGRGKMKLETVNEYQQQGLEGELWYRV